MDSELVNSCSRDLNRFSLPDVPQSPGYRWQSFSHHLLRMSFFTDTMAESG